MTSGRYGVVSREVGRLLGSGTVAALGPGQLLERYAVDRDESAFEALVTQHGPMVLGTCRRMLADPHDVDDAFQATFLVLARKAGSIRDADRLGPWLHGVARRVATRARALSARRNARERSGSEDLAVEIPNALEDFELRAAIDEELSRLPEKYRVPLVLCYLEGLTHDEAARQLRWPVGTVRSRLAGGRDRLRDRLSRRGITPSVAIPGLLPPFSIPQALLTTTVRVATSAGSPSAHVATLAKGALVAMIWNKFKVVVVIGLMTGLTVGGAGVAAQLNQDPGENDTPQATAVKKQIASLVEERNRLQRKMDDLQTQISQLGIQEKSLIEQARIKPVDPKGQPLKNTTNERPRMESKKAATVDDPTRPPTTVFAPQPIVHPLSGNSALFLVISAERDRVMIVNSATQERSTFRLPKPATEITPVDHGSLISLIIKGPEITKTAVYERASKRWYEYDLGEPATEIHVWSGSSMMATNKEPYALQVKGPKVSRLAVFDLGEKKWTTQDLKEPGTRVGPSMTQTTATYSVGRFIFIYSILAKKWTTLELSRPYPEGQGGGLQIPPNVDGNGNLVLPDGDLIHTYSARTGEWTHIDIKSDK